MMRKQRHLWYNGYSLSCMPWLFFPQGDQMFKRHWLPLSVIVASLFGFWAQWKPVSFKHVFLGGPTQEQLDAQHKAEMDRIQQEFRDRVRRGR
jgi:hypothetical protein